jgi:hypothetical protein
MTLAAKVSVLLILGCSFSLAQNPATAVYPGAIASDTTLGVACNSASSTLNGSITSSSTSIVLTSATGFCSPSYITIDSGLSSQEVIAICSIATNTLTVCTSGRAIHGTAAAHSSGASVNIFIDQNYLNQTNAELKAIEGALGARMTNVGYIFAEQYGVVGNGSTNNTTALQNAINAGEALSPPWPVLLPCGYIDTNTVTIGTSGMALVGPSKNCVFLEPYSITSGNLITVTASGFILSHVSILGTAGAAYTLVNLSGAPNSILDDFYLYGGAYGLYCTTSGSLTVVNGDLWDAGTDYIYISEDTGGENELLNLRGHKYATNISPESFLHDHKATQIDNGGTYLDASRMDAAPLEQFTVTGGSCTGGGPYTATLSVTANSGSSFGALYSGELIDVGNYIVPTGYFSTSATITALGSGTVSFHIPGAASCPASWSSGGTLYAAGMQYGVMFDYSTPITGGCSSASSCSFGFVWIRDTILDQTLDSAFYTLNSSNAYAKNGSWLVSVGSRGVTFDGSYNSFVSDCVIQTTFGNPNATIFNLLDGAGNNFFKINDYVITNGYVYTVNTTYPGSIDDTGSVMQASTASMNGITNFASATTHFTLAGTPFSYSQLPGVAGVGSTVTCSNCTPVIACTSGGGGAVATYSSVGLSCAIGMGSQTVYWAGGSVVISGRALNTVYHNTSPTARYIQVSVSLNATSAQQTIFCVTDSSSSPSTTVAYYQLPNPTTLLGYTSIGFWVLSGNYFNVDTTSGVTVIWWTEWN